MQTRRPLRLHAVVDEEREGDPDGSGVIVRKERREVGMILHKTASAPADEPSVPLAAKLAVDNGGWQRLAKTERKTS